MKSFSTAYYVSRKESKAEKEALIEQEHIKIISAMKHEFGINNFGTLTEAEKKSYRSMLNEMWTRENGLTEKGIKFLTEAAAPLTKDSTPEQIEKQFKKEIKANIIALVATLNSDSPSFEHAAKAKKAIEDQIGHKISSKDCKTWMYDVMAKYLADKIRGYKF